MNNAPGVAQPKWAYLRSAAGSGVLQGVFDMTLFFAGMIVGAIYGVLTMSFLIAAARSGEPFDNDGE